MVRARFPSVQLTELDWNAGFCIANNLGLASSVAPYVLLLNPDTELIEPTLDHMVELMEGDPRIGLSCCRLVKRDGTFDHASKRSFPTPISALAHFTGLGRRSEAPTWLAQYRAPDVDEHGVGEVDAVAGAFMFARREAVEEVGPLDERYWLYMEDLDWCRRFWERGWKVLYDGRVTAIHVKGAMSVRKQHRGFRHNLAFHRGMGRFYRKFEAGRRPLLDLAVYLGIGLKLSIAVVRSFMAHRRLTIVRDSRDG
jgi:GT2 family glycosyltransferase